MVSFGENHMQGCKCIVCEFGPEVARAMEKKSIEEYGWFSHAVTNDSLTPYNINYHTHGIELKYNHKDFQICFPIDPRVAHKIFWSLVDELRLEKKFEAENPVTGILKNYTITFKDATENGRSVLRIILPDTQGNLDPKTMHKDFVKQWD